MTKIEQIEERCRVAMRKAIRKHHKAKQWAQVNSEDNFCLVIYATAERAMLEIVGGELNDEKVADWFNDLCVQSSPKTPLLEQSDQLKQNDKLRGFVLTTCREMYKLLLCGITSNNHS